MPARKEEHLNLQPFQIGAFYTRPDIASLGQVVPLATTREWTGIVEFMNCSGLSPLVWVGIVVGFRLSFGLGL